MAYTYNPSIQETRGQFEASLEDLAVLSLSQKEKKFTHLLLKLSFHGILQNQNGI